jgi:hypothetical protein
MRYVTGYIANSTWQQGQFSVPQAFDLTNLQEPCEAGTGGETTEDECVTNGGTWNPDTFELCMGERWAFCSDRTYTDQASCEGAGKTWIFQQGGLAGSGSTGVWGVQVADFTADAGFTVGDGSRLDTGQLTYQKLENVFDIKAPYNFGGAEGAAQADLCIRCHSYYAYKTALPNVPDGSPDGSPGTETDIVADFNPYNVAHHAVFARGNNQPIRANYNNANLRSWYNMNWPYYSNGNITISGGLATLASGTLPRTVLPGWSIYIGANSPPAELDDTGRLGDGSSGFLEIWDIVSDTQFRVRRQTNATWANSNSEMDATWATNITVSSTGNWFLTAGLGNAFVPPFGPWTQLRCTDCHGSTKSDPVGPHASVNKWLLKDADVNNRFEWFDTSGSDHTAVTTIDYQVSPMDDANTVLDQTEDKFYFCFNCHRADTYGSESGVLAKNTPTNEGQSRLLHGSQMWVKDGSNIAGTGGAANTTFHRQFCRHCHGGDTLGGLHGSNRAQGTGGETVPQSIRFLNGATWRGLERPTFGSNTITCYTQDSAEGGTSTVSSCSQHSGGTGYTNMGISSGVNYDYSDY